MKSAGITWFAIFSRREAGAFVRVVLGEHVDGVAGWRRSGTTLMEGSRLKSSTSVLEARPFAVDHADVVDVAGLEGGRRDLEGHRDLVVAADQRAADLGAVIG